MEVQFEVNHHETNAVQATASQMWEQNNLKLNIERNRKYT